jgi:hypothetical protein
MHLFISLQSIQRHHTALKHGVPVIKPCSHDRGRYKNWSFLLHGITWDLKIKPMFKLSRWITAMIKLLFMKLFAFSVNKRRYLGGTEPQKIHIVAEQSFFLALKTSVVNTLIDCAFDRRLNTWLFFAKKIRGRREHFRVHIKIRYPFLLDFVSKPFSVIVLLRTFQCCIQKYQISCIWPYGFRAKKWTFHTK